MSLELSGTTGVKGVAGSVSAPSIVGDDTNTGISFPSADTIKFSTGGVERMSITNSGVSGITAGITMADQWRITSTFNVSSSAYITSNWERNDSPGYGKIGTGMSESSGLFSFPETGIYLVGISLTGNSDGGQFNYVACDIETTLNNSSFTGVGATYQSVSNNNEHWHMETKILFDVTDISTHKVKFLVYATNTRPMVFGSSAHNATFAYFTRLGDT